MVVDSHEQMASALAAGPRQTCGSLRAADIGRTATLHGWVNRRRDHGGLIFIDLRDRYGLTQLVFNPEHQPAAHIVAESIRNEFVLQITGAVARRPRPTDKFEEEKSMTRTGAFPTMLSSLAVNMHRRRKIYGSVSTQLDCAVDWGTIGRR